MSKKDDLILCLIMLLYMLTLFTAFFADRDIDALNKTVEYLIQEQEASKAQIEELKAINSEQAETIKSLKSELSYHNTRIDNHLIRLNSIQSQIEDHDTRLTALTPKASTKSKRLNVKVSDKDIRDIAALVYLESGSQSYKCQKAIASVIFNRMIRYKMTAQQVIYQRGVFTPANRVRSTTPSGSCLRAVREVLESGTTLPRSVVAFRNGNYHNFGSPYCRIDGVYFSKV